MLSRVVADRCSLANTIHFALDTAFPPPEHAFGDGVLIAQSLPREELGLSPGRQPGDVDLLVVPLVAGQLVLDRLIAVEAKIVRPTFERPHRNSNSLGGSQVLGLIGDGFLFVGLLHVSIPGSLPSDLHLTVPHLTSNFGPDRQPIPSGQFYTFDPFALYSAKRQEGRLQAIGLSEIVAYSSIAFTLSQDGERIAGNTIGNNRRGRANPNVSSKLMARVGELVMSKPQLFVEVPWFH